MTGSGQEKPAPRSDLDIEIDRAWHLAKFAQELEAKTQHWRRHNELVKQRAAQAQPQETPQ